MTRDYEGTSDSELVANALASDRQAFAEIYDRYADDIYTFCRSRLRNEADAADAMQETFVRATTRLGQLREPAKLRSWLFAIARNQIVSTGKLAARATGGDAMDEVIDLRADVDDDLLRAEASAELWDAANGLSDRDQEVLELHVRHGLSGQALADAMGVSESHANVLVSRMKDRIATALGSLLVARSGRGECDELDLLLVDWDGRFTLDLRSKVTRHIRACDVCERTQGAALATGAFMLPVLEAPTGLRTSTLDMMSEAAELSSASGGAGATAAKLQLAPVAATTAAQVWEWRPDGFPYPDEAAFLAPARPVSSRTAWLMSAAAFLLIVLLGAGVWFAFGRQGDTTVDVAGAVEENPPASTTSTSIAGAADAPTSTAGSDDDVAPPTTASADQAADDEPAVAAPTTESTTTTAAPTTTEATTTTQAPSTTTTAAPTTTSTTTSTTTTSTTTTSTTTTSTTTTTEAPPPSTDPPPPSTDPPPPNRAPIIRSVDTDPLRLTVRSDGCRGDRTQVVVEIADDGELISVIASWSPSQGSFSEVALAPRSASVYAGSVGPWDETGPHNITVVVTDDEGETDSATGSVRVTACGIGGLTG